MSLALNVLAEETPQRDFELSYLLVRSKDGSVLASQQADIPRTPASTLKVLTAVTAKEVLGLQHRFSTELKTDAKVRRGRLHGDLALIGSADPELSEDVLLELAQRLQDSGLRSVRGDLIVDPGPFAEPLYGSGWAWDDTGSSYSPEITGLDVNGGLVTLDPDNLPSWANHVSLEESQSSSAYLVPGRAKLQIRGKTPKRVAAPEAPLRAGEFFREALKQRGIHIRGDIRLRPFQGGRVLVRHDSRPLKELLTRALAESDNLAMELFWRASDQKRPSLLKEAKLRQSDGSGLSRYNLVTARQFVNVLLSETWLQDILPAPGQGTLKKRFRAQQKTKDLVAKTGSLSNISGLTGYLYPGTEKECAFCILINSHLGTYAERKSLEDKLVDTWLKSLGD